MEASGWPTWGAEPQATSQTDPAPVAPGGVPLGGDSPPAEAAPAKLDPMEARAADSAESARAASSVDTSVPSAGAPEVIERNAGGNPTVIGGNTPARFDATHPAPALVATADGLRQHNDPNPEVNQAPGGPVDLPQAQPSTAGVSEPEQIETERPDIGTPGT